MDIALKDEITNLNFMYFQLPFALSAALSLFQNTQCTNVNTFPAKEFLLWQRLALDIFGEEHVFAIVDSISKVGYPVADNHHASLLG